MYARVRDYSVLMLCMCVCVHVQKESKELTDVATLADHDLQNDSVIYMCWKKESALSCLISNLSSDAIASIKRAHAFVHVCIMCACGKQIRTSGRS